MVSLDEKEIKKEQRAQEAEERRNRRRKKQINESQKKNKKNKLTDKAKKEIAIGISLLTVVVLIIIFAKPFMNYLKNAGRDTTYDGYLLMTNMTGFKEDDAMNELRKIGFVNIRRTYIYDKFTEDKCVVKANYHINSLLKPDTEIILYICDQSLIKDYIDDEQVLGGSFVAPNTTYFSMDNITIVDLAIKDNKFYCIAKNNNTTAIKNIEFRIGYQDASGLAIGYHRYPLDDELIILPGEKFTISGEISEEKQTAKYLYIDGFSYDKVEVPSNERN